MFLSTTLNHLRTFYCGNPWESCDKYCWLQDVIVVCTAVAFEISLVSSPFLSLFVPHIARLHLVPCRSFSLLWFTNIRLQYTPPSIVSNSQTILLRALSCRRRREDAVQTADDQHDRQSWQQKEVHRTPLLSLQPRAYLSLEADFSR